MRIAQEFCVLVSMAARDAQWEPSQQAIWTLFCDEYLADDDYYEYVAHEVFGMEGRAPVQLALKVRYGGQGALLRSSGRDLIHAIVSALGWSHAILLREMSLGGLFASAKATAFAEVLVQGRITYFGIGVSANTTAAMIMAVLSAVNRALRRGSLDDSMRVAATQDSTFAAPT